MGNCKYESLDLDPETLASDLLLDKLSSVSCRSQNGDLKAKRLCYLKLQNEKPKDLKLL